MDRISTKEAFEVAAKFGHSLDNDAFKITEGLLSGDCRYTIGTEVLVGPKAICNSYEQNMIEGRKKLDVLEWGQSRIESINEHTYYVHFTDYLTHKGESYTHRCKQKLTISSGGLITAIEHIHDDDEQQRLDAYYRRVGLK